MLMASGSLGVNNNCEEEASMTMPGFSAENSIGKTIPYLPTRSRGGTEGVHPAFLSVEHCYWKLETVWVYWKTFRHTPLYAPVQKWVYTCD